MSIRKRNSVLARAAAATLYHAKEEGAGGAPPATPPSTPPATPPNQPAPDAPKPDKTQADIDAAVKAALVEYERKQADKARKDEEERDRAEAEKRGEFEKVAQQEKQRRERAEAELAQTKLEQRIDRTLAAYLKEKHKSHIGVAEKYVLKMLELKPGDDDAAISKAIQVTTDQYVKDHPSQSGGGGAPGQTGRGQRAAEGERPKKDDAANGRDREYSLPARRGF